MSWVVAVVGAVAFVELLLRLPLGSTLGALSSLAARAVRVVRSRRISDHWKERVLLTYAGGIARRSLLLALLVALALAPMASLAVLFEALGVPVYSLLSSWAGILVCTLAGLLYGMARARVVGLGGKS
ncbi:MAG: hypothetical protein U9R22_04895 [Pseudomonadota bacterium]|nr:hypothetical protein [Pseudomonadota bacterium]